MFNRPDLKIKRRIIFLFIIFILVFAGIILRLSWIQIINSTYYQQKALDQRLRYLKVEARRGIIYDRNGKELAVSSTSETVVAIPLEIEDKEKTADKLASILELDYKTVYQRLNRDASAVYIKRKVAEGRIERLKELDIAGITYTEESKRYYPKNNLLSNVLGFAGIDSQGLDGLELSYDKYLKGVPGKLAAEKDAAGRTIPEGIKEYIAPEDGYNIYLTIDEVIQYIAERELDRALEEYNISGGTIIVMDPENGAIRALANRPDYDPNNFADYPQKYWRNRGISDSYEPGSTFKIITTASALEEGVVNENDPFSDPGHIMVSGEKISCWKYGGHGHQTFKDVVKNSCNVGFVQVGMRLGKSAFYNYINAFGFGERTGIKLPGEASGLVYDFDEIGPVELATMSFGHGITVTPIQLITAVSAIANDGMLIRPRLVEKIVKNDDEEIKEIKPIKIRQVISKETARRTRRLLERVVDDGTGVAAKIEGYCIGGKTGTAKHYGKEVYDSSFIGIIPVDDPKLVILVALYDVTGVPYYASQTAAPTFRNVALDTLRYLDIPPQSPLANDKNREIKLKVPDVKGMDVLKAEEMLRNNGFDVKLIGIKDEIIEQIPTAGAEVLENTTIILITEEDDIIRKNYYVAVPDLIGMSEKEAKNLLAGLGLKIRAEGEGKIVEQDIKVGTRIPGGEYISCKLEND